MEKDWRDLHGKTISAFLSYLNNKTNKFVLKGGTALAQCYALDRFSEDIDLDAEKENILHHVDGFCHLHGFSYRVAKDTSLVKRAFISYGNVEKPLKIEVSYRNTNISTTDITTINNITVYTINRLAQMKANAYNARDKIRDLYDLAFITNQYYPSLEPSTKNIIADALAYKGLEQFEYIVKTQKDDLIDPDQLALSFLKMYDRLGLLYDAKEYSEMKTNITKSK